MVGSWRSKFKGWQALGCFGYHLIRWYHRCWASCWCDLAIGSQLEGLVLSPKMSPVFIMSVLLDIELCIATNCGLYLLRRGKAHWTSLSPVCRSCFGYVIAKFHYHSQNFVNAVAKWSAGSLRLLVQSLIAIAPGHGRKLLSDKGHSFLLACRASTSPWGDRWAFRSK